MGGGVPSAGPPPPWDWNSRRCGESPGLRVCTGFQGRLPALLGQVGGPGGLQQDYGGPLAQAWGDPGKKVQQHRALATAPPERARPGRWRTAGRRPWVGPSRAAEPSPAVVPRERCPSPQAAALAPPGPPQAAASRLPVLVNFTSWFPTLQNETPSLEIRSGVGIQTAGAAAREPQGRGCAPAARGPSHLGALWPRSQAPRRGRGALGCPRAQAQSSSGAGRFVLWQVPSECPLPRAGDGCGEQGTGEPASGEA